MEYHSAVTRNELSSHEDAWKKLQCISQGERSQSEKTPTVGIQLSDILEKAKLWRQEKDQWLPGGRGQRGLIGQIQSIFRTMEFFFMIL